MQKLITFLSITIVIISIIASFGFTSRFKFSDSRINDVEGDFYTHSESETNSFIHNYLENHFAVFSDSTDSVKNISNNLSIITDSTKISNKINTDSTKSRKKINEDSVRIELMKLDSTARIKHFSYVQPDYYSANPTDVFKSNFFVYPSASNSQKSIELDSTGQFVLIKETIAGNEPKTMLRMPLSDYIEKMIAEVNKRELNALSRKYEVLNKDDDLGSLLSDITNIEIPLPSASFLSIFGPPKINLRVSGAVDIHGAWRNETTEGLTASALGNSRNEPDFSQQVQISVNGTIGDKLTIGADWNTERTFEYENQLKLQYKGYEDEMIQSIEAGNVSLQTSPLVGGSEALFGVKANFQFGPFSLTALASQKKSEVKEVSVSGGSEKQTYSIEALNYSENNYFLDTVYASVLPEYNMFNKYFGRLTAEVNGEYFVKELEVWRSAIGNFNPATQKRANVFINLEPRRPDETYDASLRVRNIEETPGQTVINTYFEKLSQGTDYIYNEATGFITFKTQIQRDDAIAVSYRIQGKSEVSAEDDIIYGEFWNDIKDSVVVLKLVKPANLYPDYKQAWKLQLRNIYPLGGREIKKEGFTFDMLYTQAGVEPKNDVNGLLLLNQFGLDSLDNSGQIKPEGDGFFDFREGITIIPETGEIIFPFLEPFGRDLPSKLPKDIAYPNLYSQLKSKASEDKDKNKFDLTGEYSASVSSNFQIGFNVVENSVRVTLDGKVLTNGVDYVVDYNIGQITIRNDAALVPGANLKITFEQNDLFQLASKTLVGFRGIYSFSKETQLGFSFLNLNQKTLSDKVRIGEEPISNTIYGVDFKTKHDLPFLTTALDNVFSTSAKSSFDFAGEFAYMDPDPNTKKSTIPSDDGKSIAYVDDFEASKRTIPIGISYTGWKDLSAPDAMPFDNGETKTELMAYKGKSFWYNVLPSITRTEDIWPDKEVSTKDEEVTVLDYVFRPDEKGMYNASPNLEGNSDKVWGGMMKALSSSSSNLVEEKIEAIEFWINIHEAPQGAILNLDLGQISEDVIPNLKLDTEDSEPYNEIIDEGEDNGIDGLKNVAEPDYDATNNKDPYGDDFKFVSGGINPEDFVNINGTQGNASLSDIGRFPDSEDLNGNKKVDKINSYFRYEIPLDTAKAINPFLAGGGAKKDDGSKSTWYQFKIPLKDFNENKVIGSPTFSNVEFIRLWVSGSDQDIRFQITEFNFVGSQWQKLLDKQVTESDTVLTVSNVSIEDNPDYYSPPGITREKDRTNPDENVLKNEQALDLILTDLEDGHSRTVVKYLPKGLDVFNYSEMKLFVHGDLNDFPGSISHYVDDNNYATDLYFRFGADSTNYYEYIRPTKADWEEISVNFDDLATIKETRPADSTAVAYRVPVPGKPGHYYGIRGAPSLTKISFLALGIKNPKEKGDKFEKVSGHLWVNELRVIGANDHDGWAVSSTAGIKFADIVSVSGSYRKTDPYFHKLSERFGSRVESQSWNVQSNVDIIKLMPINMPGSNLSVNYSHSESLSKPLYKPRTDVLVSKAAASSSNPDSLIRETETLTISDTWSLSNIQFKIPSKEWYIRETVNGLSFTYTYNSSSSRNPATEAANSWGWNGSGKYQAKFSNENYIYPANIPIIGEVFKLFADYRNVKFYFTPQNFDASIAAKRSYTYTKSRTIGLAPSISRDFSASRNAGFNWNLTEGGFFNLSTSYKLNIASSLLHLLTDYNGKERPESEIWSDIFNGNLFGKDNNYSQSVNLNVKPKMPSILSLDKFFTITSSYSVTYSWQNNFSQVELGRSAGWANRINGNLTVKLKSIMNPIFSSIMGEEKTNNNSKAKTGVPNTTRGRYAKKDNQTLDDQLKDQDEKNKANNANDSLAVDDNSPSLLTKGLGLMMSSIQYILFDYEQISLNFSQNNSQGNSGILAEGTGFWNFWGTAQEDINGPSRLYQLGLSKDPGQRAISIGAQLSDKSSQKNEISIKTRRPLWEGANVDINWDIGWGNNKSVSLKFDEFTGEYIVSNTSASGTIDKSFMSLPLFGASVKSVNDKFDPNADDVNESLTNAFINGLESVPIFSKLPLLSNVAKYIPRPNWRISWTGLEKLPFVGLLFERASLNHGYTSNYTEGWKINTDGVEEIQTQKISYGFSPLVGLNLTFAELWGGNVIGNVKYSTKKDFNLGIGTKATTETFSDDINISLSFAKSGFQLPLFGLSLKNDIEVSLAYSQGKNSVLMYSMGEDFKEGGTPQDGTKRVTIEPRVKYVMSARVTLSIFYKRMTVEPEGASKIPATTTNEAGLDVHISIQ